MRSSRFYETANALAVFHADGTIGDAANPGSRTMPTLTVQQAVDLALAYQTANPTIPTAVMVHPGTYAEAVSLDDANVTNIAIIAATPGMVSIASVGATACALLDRVSLFNLILLDACTYVIETDADPFLASGLLAHGCDFRTALNLTGVATAALFNSTVAALSHSNCGNVLISGGPGISGLWRADWDEQADKPLGVTAAFAVLEASHALSGLAITHVDTGAAAGRTQVGLRGGSILGNGDAGHDIVLASQFADGAILVVEAGSYVIGSTDNAGNDNVISALSVLELVQGSQISNLQGWTQTGTLNDHRTFASAERTGTGAPENVTHGLGRIPDVVQIMFTELPAPESFNSAILTGDGNPQTEAHGLSGTPQLFFVTVGDDVTGNMDVATVTVDGTNVTMTVSNTDKYYVHAVFFPTAPDIAQGAHTLTDVVVTVPAGVKYSILAK